MCGRTGPPFAHGANVGAELPVAAEKDAAEAEVLQFWQVGTDKGGIDMKKLELKAGIQQYPDYTVNRARLNATLLDCYPQAEHRREINVILAVYESGVLPEFQGKNSLTPFEPASLCAQPENEYGISGEYAAEGMITWGSAQGVKVPAVIPAQATPRTVPTTPKPITPVPGSVSEYVIEEQKEGCFITRFQGFERETMTIPNVIDGKRIVGIGSEVFKGCKGIRKVTESDGIRFLEDDYGGAFEGHYLYCAPGSATMEYARKHGIQCKPL